MKDRERLVELPVPRELVLAAHQVVDDALVTFLAVYEGQARPETLFAAFVDGARASAEGTKIALFDYLLGTPPPPLDPKVQAHYDAVRRLVRDEP